MNMENPYKPFIYKVLGNSRFSEQTISVFRVLLVGPQLVRNTKKSLRALNLGTVQTDELETYSFFSLCY